MIYVAHTESTTRLPRSSNTCEDKLTGAGAQLKSCMDQRPLAQAGGHNRSLAFGPSIVRKSRSELHLCAAGEAALRTVNRLWYGRALVALRTYPQWTQRTHALEQALREMMEGGGDAHPIKLGSPVQ